MSSSDGSVGSDAEDQERDFDAGELAKDQSSWLAEITGDAELAGMSDMAEANLGKDKGASEVGRRQHAYVPRAPPNPTPLTPRSTDQARVQEEEEEAPGRGRRRRRRRRHN